MIKSCIGSSVCFDNNFFNNKKYPVTFFSKISYIRICHMIYELKIMHKSRKTLFSEYPSIFDKAVPDRLVFAPRPTCVIWPVQLS